MSTSSSKSTPLKFNAVHQGDCIARMSQLPAGCIDLAFADPPFNIGYKYDVYDDRKAADEYLGWCQKWIAGVHRVLKPDGAFWLAIGDEFAAELKVMAQREVGFHCRSWVIWYYTFGVNCTKKFNRSHAHLFYFVKDPKRFTFNADDPVIRVPSARQLVYADGRANPKGRLPDDTWILRPQDMENGFSADSDTWYFPRVAGTFKERAGFHGCQMPERLLGRIIRACSNEGDRVLDPFAGSGTTLAVAKKLDRSWIGFELSEEYATRVKERLNNVSVGQELDGAEDPLKSAPATKNGKVRNRLQKEKSAPSVVRASREVVAKPVVVARASRDRLATDRDAIREAYRLSSQGWSTERVITDPELQGAFVDHCRRMGVSGDQESWNRLLTRMRKQGVSGLNADRRETTDYGLLSKYVVGSEIAWKQLSACAYSLDDILCSPVLVQQFDAIASRFVPGFSTFEYRWGALYLRKRAKKARDGVLESWKLRFGPTDLLVGRNDRKLEGVSGLFVLKQQGSELFIGDSPNLAATLGLLRDLQANSHGPLHGLDEIHSLVLNQDSLDLRLKKKANLVSSARPQWNIDLSEESVCA